MKKEKINTYLTTLYSLSVGIIILLFWMNQVKIKATLPAFKEKQMVQRADSINTDDVWKETEFLQ